MDKTAKIITNHGVELKAPTHVRFSDLTWYDPEYLKFITIGGVGGIGSWTALALSRAGYKLILHDIDNVDETNLGGQFYSIKDIGQLKTRAVVNSCILYGAEQALYEEGAITATSAVSNVCISAFDNMKARETLFNCWLEKVKTKSESDLFIDGRMLAESGQVFFVPNEEKAIEAYKKSLFADSEVKDQPCSAKATSHCGMRIASEITAGLTNWLTNVMMKENIREVPFKASFILPLNMYQTETVDEFLCQS
jgi:hypothetical protein